LNCDSGRSTKERPLNAFERELPRAFVDAVWLEKLATRACLSGEGVALPCRGDLAALTGNFIAAEVNSVAGGGQFSYRFQNSRE